MLSKRKKHHSINPTVSTDRDVIVIDDDDHNEYMHTSCIPLCVKQFDTNNRCGLIESIVDADDNHINMIESIPDHTDDHPLYTESWYKLYEPQQLTDLCIHYKKLNDIKQWITHNSTALYHRQSGAQSLLILAGPTGTCKSITIKLLCQTLGYNCVQYDHVGIDNHNTPYNNVHETKLEQFRSFLSHSIRYHSVVSSFHNNNTTKPNDIIEQQLPHHSRNIIVLEDVPFIGTDEYRHEYQQILHEFIESTRYVLIYMITTDNSVNDVSHSNMNQLDYIFGARLLNDYRVGQITTNPISPTALNKSLHRIINLVNISIPQYIVDTIIQQCNGDLTNAIQSMQMYCITKSHNNNTTKSRIKRSKKSSAGDSIDDMNTRNRNIESLGFRDESYNIFHLIGKFLYGKPDINIESLLEHSSIEISQIIDYIQYNIYNHIYNDAIDSLVYICDIMSHTDVIYQYSKYQYGDSTSSIPDINSALIVCHAVIQAKLRAQNDYDQYIQSIDIDQRQNMQRQIKPGYNVIRGPIYNKINKLSQQRATQAVEIYQYSDSTNNSNVLSNDILLSRHELVQDTLPLLHKIITPDQQSTLSDIQLQLLSDITSYSKPIKYTDTNTMLNKYQLSRTNTNVQQPIVSQLNVSPVVSMESIDPLIDDDIEEF